MNPVKQYLSIFLASILVVTGIAFYITVLNLQNDLLKEQKLTSDCRLEKEGFEGALYLQSKEILDQETDRKVLVEDLEKWKTKPSSERYKVLYNKLKKEVNLKRGDCNDTKNILNAISTIDYSDI